MDNPWLNLTEDFVLPEDEEKLKPFTYVKTQGLVPFPFFGNPSKASVYLLLSNPGYNDKNPTEHSNPGFSAAARRSLGHQSLHPYLERSGKFADFAGSRWWRRVLKYVFAEFKPEERDQVASQLMCVQLLPYHSKGFSKTTVRQVAHELPSFAYSLHLVREAVKEEKEIVVMRAPWRDLLQSNLFKQELSQPLSIYPFITVLDFTKIKAGDPVIDRETMGDKNFEQLIVKLKQGLERS